MRNLTTRPCEKTTEPTHSCAALVVPADVRVARSGPRGSPRVGNSALAFRMPRSTHPEGPRVPPGPPPRARGSGPRRPRRRRPRIERATRRRRVHLLLVRLLLPVRAGGDARAPARGHRRGGHPLRLPRRAVLAGQGGHRARAGGRAGRIQSFRESRRELSTRIRIRIGVARVRRRHRRAGFGGDRGGRRGRAAVARARRAGPRAGHLGHPQVAGAGARRGGGGG